MRASRTGDWPDVLWPAEAEGWRRWDGKGRPEYDMEDELEAVSHGKFGLRPRLAALGLMLRSGS